MLDRVIIDHASPALARLKLDSLINLDIGEGFFGEFARLGGELRGKSVKLTILRRQGGKALAGGRNGLHRKLRQKLPGLRMLEGVLRPVLCAADLQAV